jgi:glycosylphosphatidylinositol phospholipase D
LLPANGGDGSKGFVVSGIDPADGLGSDRFEPVGDINQDGVADFFIAAPAAGSTDIPGHAYLIFGRAGGFPAELDLHTLDGTTGYVVDGPQAQTSLSVGGAGDLNHDGVPDLVVGARGASPTGDRARAGQTFVIFGGAANLVALDLADGARDGRIGPSALDGPRGFVINGAAADDFSGQLVDAAGDVNHDGIADLILSAPERNNAGPTPGKAYVIFGRTSFPAVVELSALDGTDGFLIRGSGGNDEVGSSVAGAGDVNGDGIADIIVGVYDASPSGRANAGQAYVIFGRPTFPATFSLSSINGGNGFAINGSVALDCLGAAVDGIGDFNGDGVSDVAVGALGTGQDYTGSTYVVFGKRTSTAGPFPASLDVSTLNGTNGLAIRGLAHIPAANSYVAGVGDTNGDGYADLLIGAYNADPNNVNDAGQSFLVYGGASFPTALRLSSMLASSGGDGSVGLVLNGFLASGQAGRVAEIGDINGDGLSDMFIGAPNAAVDGRSGAGQGYIVYGKPSPPPVTKFYVVNDATSPDRTYEYTAAGTAVENYGLNSGNTAPRGAASTAAGTTVWVVDANKKVYVYNNGGGLLGSWTAGSLASNATVEGIATNGADVWIVDARQDKVFRYTSAAGRTSGSQNAASSFSLNSANTSPKDIVTDGTYLWVVNDSSTDKVFKYTLTGSLLGSWTITGAGSSPTGITLDPTGGGTLWIVDGGTDRVYQFDNARGRTSGSQSPSTYFALAAGNTDPQGIADPPKPASDLAPLTFWTESDLSNLAAELIRTGTKRAGKLSRG